MSSGDQHPGPADVRVLVAVPAAAARGHVGALRCAAMAVDVTSERDDLIHALEAAPYDAVVAGSAASGRHLGEVRAAMEPEAALLVVTTGPSPDERIAALADGADDAVAPDVGAPELVLRVAKAVVRRTATDRGPLHLGRVVVDRSRRTAVLDGARAPLTQRQLCVLLYLAGHRDRLVSTDELLEHCWDRRRDEFSNPLPTQVTRLRGAFAGALELPWIERGGYRLVVVATPAEV